MLNILTVLQVNSVSMSHSCMTTLCIPSWSHLTCSLPILPRVVHSGGVTEGQWLLRLDCSLVTLSFKVWMFNDRAHYHTPSMLQCQCHGGSLLMTITYILWRVHEQKAHNGSVHRHGQQNEVFGPCQMIWSIMKPVFTCTYESLRCLDLQVRWFCADDDDR